MDGWLSHHPPPPLSRGHIFSASNTALQVECMLLDALWRSRRETLRNVVLALTFLLALSVHWLVTDSLREVLVQYRRQVLARAAYPLTVALLLWVSRSWVR